MELSELENVAILKFENERRVKRFGTSVRGNDDEERCAAGYISVFLTAENAEEIHAECAKERHAKTQSLSYSISRLLRRSSLQ